MWQNLGISQGGEVEIDGGGLFLTSSDEELMARALDLEKETSLKKCQVKKKKKVEEEVGDRKKMEQQHLQMDSEENEELLQATLALKFKEERNAVFDHPHADDHHQSPS